MSSDKSRNAMPQGSLDMLILRTLQLGSQHGYAIARHLHVASNSFFQVEEGSLYPALHRLEHRGLIAAEWGPSEANRRAKFYTLTPAGKQALKEQTNAWLEMQQAISNIMNFRPKGGLNMTWFDALWRRLFFRGLIPSASSRGAVHEELMFHFRELVNEKIAEGQPFDSAWEQAEQQFGSLRRYEDECQSIQTERRLAWRIAGAFAVLFLLAYGAWSRFENQSLQLRDELRLMHESLTRTSHEQIQLIKNGQLADLKPPQVDGTDLTGQVLNEVGQPLFDAMVLVILKTWPDGFYRQEAFSATTNIEGRFVLPELIPVNGQYAIQVAALKDGFAFKSNYQLIQSAHSKSLDPITLQLEPSSIVTLVVRDSSGNPIPNAHVAPSSRKSKHGEDHLIYFQGSEPAHQTTDDQGRVRLSCFHTGDSAQVCLQLPGNDWDNRTFDVSSNEIVVVVASSESNVK